MIGDGAGPSRPRGLRHGSVRCIGALVGAALTRPAELSAQLLVVGTRQVRRQHRQRRAKAAVQVDRLVDLQSKGVGVVQFSDRAAKGYNRPCPRLRDRTATCGVGRPS